MVKLTVDYNDDDEEKNMTFEQDELEEMVSHRKDVTGISPPFSSRHAAMLTTIHGSKWRLIDPIASTHVAAPLS
jgi:hypothetical protein